jgi:hypothetical protein
MSHKRRARTSKSSRLQKACEEVSNSSIGSGLLSGINIRIPGEGELMVIDINYPKRSRARLRPHLTPSRGIPSRTTTRARTSSRPTPRGGTPPRPIPKNESGLGQERRPPAGAHAVSNHHGCGGASPGPCFWCQEGSGHILT